MILTHAVPARPTLHVGLRGRTALIGLLAALGASTLAGCGATAASAAGTAMPSVPAAVAPAPAPAAVHAASVQATASPAGGGGGGAAEPGDLRAAIARMAYRDPSEPFHSDKFVLGSGSFVPLEDGGSPTGDVEFFYDGQGFFARANQDGGAHRSLVGPDGAAVSILPLRAGALIQLRTEGGTAWIEVDRLVAGSMAFDRSGGGSGSGEVDFRYSTRAL